MANKYVCESSLDGLIITSLPVHMNSTMRSRFRNSASTVSMFVVQGLIQGGVVVTRANNCYKETERPGHREQFIDDER